MNGLKIIIGSALLVVVLLAALLYWLFITIPFNALVVWAIAVTMLLVPIFSLGFYFGKVEVRGWLAGADQTIDRLSLVVRDVVQVRDASRIAITKHTAQGFASTDTAMGVLPPIRARSLTAGEEEA